MALRNAGLKPGGKDLWASQDRSAIDRAARNFCLGLKHLFKRDWAVPFTVSVSEEAPYVVKVGGEMAVTASIEDNKVVYDWHGDWKTWDELHNSPEVIQLFQKSRDLAARASIGMKGASASRGPKGSAKGSTH